jgi:glutathione S-transferase
MIEVYDSDMSVCAQQVRRLLAGKKLDYERHHPSGRAGDPFWPEYLEFNP